MTDPNRNLLWGRAVMEELVRSGVRDLCLSPGSRSAPLALAAQRQPRLRVTTHFDERGGAYFALGVAKATQRPVALLCTSGTALANYLPAIAEANNAAVPLIVLSADRPPELHEVGANQTMPQAGIFDAFVRFSADLGPPEPTPERVRHLRLLVDQAVAASRGPPAGPVHLNFPFREPLDDRHIEGDIPASLEADAEACRGNGDAPLATVAPTSTAPDPEAIDLLVDRIRAEPRGIIVAGPRWTRDALDADVAALCAATGYPVLADPLSGLRYSSDGPTRLISAYDAYLGHAPTAARLRPRLVLRLGASPTSKALLSFLTDLDDAFQGCLDETERGWDETRRAQLFLRGDAGEACRAITAAVAGRATPDAAWAPAWMEADSAACEFHDREASKSSFEGALASALVAALPAGSALFVSNSLPIRDVDRFAPARSGLTVFANRGASGIDGILHTALGVSYGLGRKVTLLVGDLAFLHDMNALVTMGRLGLALDVVLVENDGGGLFEFLPVSASEGFTELFVTPHGVDVAGVARALGVAHQRFTDVPSLVRAYRAGGTVPGPRILEFQSDRHENVRRRRDVERILHERLEQLATGARHA